MLKRKLIYTAITRAKKYLIMLGNIEALRKGIVQIEEKRKTKLQDRLHEMIVNGNIIFDQNSAFSEVKEEKLDSVSISDFMDKSMEEITSKDKEQIDLFEMENISPYDFMDDEE